MSSFTPINCPSQDSTYNVAKNMAPTIVHQDGPPKKKRKKQESKKLQPPPKTATRKKSSKSGTTSRDLASTSDVSAEDFNVGLASLQRPPLSEFTKSKLNAFRCNKLWTPTSLAHSEAQDQENILPSGSPMKDDIDVATLRDYEAEGLLSSSLRKIDEPLSNYTWLQATHGTGSQQDGPPPSPAHTLIVQSKYIGDEAEVHDQQTIPRDPGSPMDDEELSRLLEDFYHEDVASLQAADSELASNAHTSKLLDNEELDMDDFLLDDESLKEICRATSSPVKEAQHMCPKIATPVATMDSEDMLDVADFDDEDFLNALEIDDNVGKAYVKKPPACKEARMASIFNPKPGTEVKIQSTKDQVGRHKPRPSLPSRNKLPTKQAASRVFTRSKITPAAKTMMQPTSSQASGLLSTMSEDQSSTSSLVKVPPSKKPEQHPAQSTNHSRFVRPPQPPAVETPGPIPGLTSQGRILTCFRIGEAINATSTALRQGNKAFIELYARVLHSTRAGPVQSFRIVDLWSSPDKLGIVLDGRWVGWDKSDLWEMDGRTFWQDGFRDVEYGHDGRARPFARKCRLVGSLERKPTGGWLVNILNIWEAGWDDISYIKSIICEPAAEEEHEGIAGKEIQKEIVVID